MPRCWRPPTTGRSRSAWLLALLLGAGVYGSVHSLAGAHRPRAPGAGQNRCRRATRAGHRHRALPARSTAGADIAPASSPSSPSTASEGPHPFTIASADRGDRTISFQIKALGDYTRGLADRLQAGTGRAVEGPYGRFDIARRNPRAQQIWIAGGIGVTPFLAWLESLQANPGNAPAADLHYCTRDRAADPFVARLESLCASLPGVRLQVHGAQQGEVLTAPAC